MKQPILEFHEASDLRVCFLVQADYNEKVKKVYQNQKIRVYYDKDVCRHFGKLHIWFA